MKRRQFLGALGGAMVLWPKVARTQQATVPLIGFLRNATPESSENLSAAFRQGLSEVGYVERASVAIEYRWARGHYDLLPKLSAELVRLGPAAIFAGGTGEALAVKATKTTIPIVFTGASDPVRVGLVSTFNRPGGNLTGSTMISHSLGAKRLELLQQLIPNAATIAVLVNPNNPSAKSEINDTQDAARALGLAVVVIEVSREAEFDLAIATAAQKKVGAIVVAGDPLFTAHGYRIAGLVLQHKLPSIYTLREYAASGGLVSYGASFADAYRQCGTYVGRILKGEKPADLPVLQPTRFDLVLNLKTAKALDLAVSDKLIALADEVIE